MPEENHPVPLSPGQRTAEDEPSTRKGRGGLSTWSKAVRFHPGGTQAALLAPRRLPRVSPQGLRALGSLPGQGLCSSHGGLLCPGTLARRPSDKAASRLARALGTPAANTLLDLVLARSWLYWQGVGADCEQASRTGSGPRVSGRHQEPCGAQRRPRRREMGTSTPLFWGGLRSRERQRGLRKRSRSPGRQTTLMNFLVLLLVNPG